MKISTKFPIVFFDLETTGLDISKDRIIEIAMLKIHPDGKRETWRSLINPGEGISISEENQAIHGISNEDVADAPLFNDKAQEIATFIGEGHLCGYNSNKFDIPVLAEAFLSAGIKMDLKNRRFIDVQNIFHKKEQRTLEAAYLFYCQKELKNAHSALADTEATAEILFAQLEKYEDLDASVEFLADYSNVAKNELVDFAGRLARNAKGEVIYNFGKHKGKTVAKVDEEESGYYGWMLNANFPLYTKEMLKEEMDRIKEERAKKGSEKKKTPAQRGKAEPITEDKLKALQQKFGK